MKMKLVQLLVIGLMFLCNATYLPAKSELANGRFIQNQ